MGRIWTEAGAIRAIQRKGYLNCFSSPQRRYFVVSSIPLSREGSVLLHGVARSLMLKRKLELVGGDSFAAAYRLKVPASMKALQRERTGADRKPKAVRILAEGNV